MPKDAATTAPLSTENVALLLYNMVIGLARNSCRISLIQGAELQIQGLCELKERVVGMEILLPLFPIKVFLCHWGKKIKLYNYDGTITELNGLTKLPVPFVSFWGKEHEDTKK